MRYLLVILFALFSIAGNAQVFETQFEKGSYIERFTKAVLVNFSQDNGTLKRTEKGIAWNTIGASNLNLGTTLPTIIKTGNEFSVVCFFKTPPNDITTRQAFIGSSDGVDRYMFAVEGGIIRFSELGGGVVSSTTIKPNIWHCGIFTNTTGNVHNMYLNGITQTGSTAASSHHSDTRTFLGAAGSGGSSPYTGNISKMVVYDRIITDKERADLYEQFLNSTAFLVEKHPKYGPWNKPTSLNDPGLVAAYNMIPSAGGVLTDISGNGNNGTISGPISSVAGLVFDGTNDNVVIGNVGNVKSISFRIKPISTTEQILEGAANDKLIHINSGTLTYSDYDDAYVDGINTNTVVADQWQNVVIISSTNVDNPAATLALNNATYGAFEIEDLKFYSIELSQQQAQDYHNSFAKRVVLTDNFEYDAVGTAIPQGWTPGTGTYEVKELAAQDAVLKHLDVGTKYLECTSAGTIAIPSKSAYGTWEFDWYKGGAGNNLVVFFITPLVTMEGWGSDIVSFRLLVLNAEDIYLQFDNGIVLFNTVASYILINTWYRKKITRTHDGEFYMYIKGGAFGKGWVLVDVSGGSGTNPATETANQSSNKFKLDFDVGDRIANIQITDGVIQ